MALIFDDKNNSFSITRIKKIREYAERQERRTEAEKQNDFQEVTEEQQGWINHRINAPARTWERWNADKVREVWEPWNRFGEPVNRWRYIKL